MMLKYNQTRLLQQTSKVKHCFKTNSRSSKQDQEKDKASKQSNWLISFCLKQIVSKRLKALVIDYQAV